MSDTHGHEAHCDHCGPEEERKTFISPELLLKILTPISGGLLLLGLSSYFWPLPVSAGVLYAASIAASSIFVVNHAVKGLIRQRFLNISFLVVVASVGAIYIGEYGEAAAVLFLFSLGELFESYGIERSRRAVRALLQQSPKVARLLNGQTVPVASVSVGTVVAVKPGESLPLDGVVINGTSTVDESAVTGESIPVDKQRDDAVYAGTMNIQGYLEVQVTKLSTDSTFSKIIALIEKAQASRAPTQAFIDSFARYYTPLMVSVAGLLVLIPTALGLPFEIWLYRAITLLVIACPCALVIATPVAIASAIGGASRHGILIKGGKYLEQLAKVQAVAFDKTRTLTFGRHTVTDVIACGSHTAEEVIADAAGVEAQSSHPLAEAITAYAKEKNIALHTMDGYQNVPGKGGHAQCRVCEKPTYIGNKKLLDSYGITSQALSDDIERLEREGKTVVLVAEGDELLGILAISDEIRPEAKDAVATLKSQSIASAMLTGDNNQNAQYVGNIVGITDIRASLLPEEKLIEIQKLKEKHGVVAMVGDGINDAPALAASDIGFAIGAGGTDAAIESSDITLLTGNLQSIELSVRLAKRTMAIIRVNVIMALGIKVLFLALTPFGMANLVLAIAADSGMALVVILNSLRLFKVR